MNRRESLKAIGLTTISTGILIDACKPKDKKQETPAAPSNENDEGYTTEEAERTRKLKEEKFFTDHEMATITVLADIIIPKDDRSGSASDAGVPEFIEFIVKDLPDNKVPMRGGLRWLDMQCLTRYNNPFKDCSGKQQIEMVEEIAYPGRAKPDMHQGVTFFTRMRNLTASGFWSSKM